MVNVVILILVKFFYKKSQIFHVIFIFHKNIAMLQKFSTKESLCGNAKNVFNLALASWNFTDLSHQERNI